MNYDFSNFDARAAEITTWLEKELATIRTGQATPAILDSIQVSSYGAKVPINQVGSIGIEDPRTLRVSVWDASQVSEVEGAIRDADLGLAVTADDSGVRVSFPELTGERREELIKIAKNKLEESRISLRTARDETMKGIEKEEMSDDEKFGVKDKLQKKVEAATKVLDDHFDTKQSEMQI